MGPIVVGAYETAQGLAALERGVDEARREGCELVLVGHVGGPRGSEEAAAYPDRFRTKEREVTAHAERVEAESGVSCRAVVPQVGLSTPAETILQVANREGARLIVIGVRRRTRVGKLLLGSNAQDVILKAECPVLAVKAPDGT